VYHLLAIKKDVVSRVDFVGSWCIIHKKKKYHKTRIKQKCRGDSKKRNSRGDYVGDKFDIQTQEKEKTNRKSKKMGMSK